MFSLVVHGTVPKDEMCGIVVGHIWYFFNDVYPPLHDGHSPLDPPYWWIRLFEGRPAEPEVDLNTNAEPIDHDVAAAAAPEVR